MKNENLLHGQKKKCVKIAVYNNKGGVGKTTFAANFANAIASGILGEAKKVCVVDNDGQANLSMVMTGLTEDEIADTYETTIFDLMTDEDVSAQDCIVKTKFKNIDIIPATDDHSDTPDAISNEVDNTRILKEKIHNIEDKYDFIIIDCAPTRDRNVYNALFACDIVITPLEAQLFSRVGLRNLLGQIAKVNKKRETPILHYAFLSKVDNRQKCKNVQVRNNLESLLDDNFLKESISHLAVYVKAFEEGITAIECIDDKGKKEVMSLTKTILRKIDEELI